jgi:hypothetical protein
VGTQVQQSVSVSPTVTYGDLVWISTTPTSHYSASDPQTFIAGSGGTIATQFGTLGQYALGQGQSFYYNILPEVKLDMAVASQAQLNLPASLTASYNVFGVGGSQSFPLGNLYTLSTGAQGFDVSTTFHDNEYYSVKIDLSHPSDFGQVAGTYTSQFVPGDDPLPPDTGPCAGTPVGCTLTVPGGAGSLTGYGRSECAVRSAGDARCGDLHQPGHDRRRPPGGAGNRFDHGRLCAHLARRGHVGRARPQAFNAIEKPD